MNMIGTHRTRTDEIGRYHNITKMIIFSHCAET